MCNAWFFILSGVALFASSEVTTTISRETLSPGERAQVSLTVPKDATSPPVLSDAPLETASLKILGREERDLGQSYQWLFDVTGYLPGRFYFPALSIASGPHSYSTERIPFTVTTTRELQDEALRPSYGELSLPLPWRRIGQIATVLFALLYALSRIVPFLRKRTEEPPAPALSPEDWLARELKGQASLTHDQCDHFITAIHDYFHRLGERFTAAETLRELARSPRKEIRALVPILKSCDSFRYHSRKQAEGPLISSCIQQVLRLLPCTN
ncbi:MAG: hypothetical protein HYR96_09480 [Deltaproteobacteria bacterium]|nr:hypothetical protein [Deltaproteobacteria bacterium]MBI3295081.1 hypothetical protein [Deltaproteobacteria bacterium]